MTYHSRFSSILLFGGLQQTLEMGSKFVAGSERYMCLTLLRLLDSKGLIPDIPACVKHEPVILLYLFSNWRAACDMNWAYLKYFLWYCHLPSNSRQPVRDGPFLRSTMGCGGSVGKAVSIDSLEAGKRAKWEGPWVVAPPNSQTNSDEFCWMSHTPFWECERNQQC